MSEMPDEKPVTDQRRSRPRPSLFGPIVLIAIGVFFLLINLDVISGRDWNWVALLQLWPVWLILLGVNVIVRQAPGALGSWLSALVGVLAVAILGYILFFAEDSAWLNRLGVSRSLDVQTEAIEFAADDLRSATINISFGAPGADLYALRDSGNLIEGNVSYTGRLIFDTNVSGDRATVRLDSVSESNNDWLFYLNPANWGDLADADRWEVGLSPNVETDLRLDIGSGSVDLNLAGLDLSGLDVNGGSGSAELVLAVGDYEAAYDAGSGSTRMTLPSSGSLRLDITGGSGSMTYYVPESLEARVELNGGSGGFNIDEGRFTLVRGDEEDGTWETAGYDDASDRVLFVIDQGSGSVTIREP